EAQLARFLHLVVEHKHRIGFEGTILIEPKPHEPTKHQYDFDVAAIAGFLERHGLTGEVKINIEVNHATLAGHDFHHEVAQAAALGLLGSIDANRGDPRLGWDTDQFPNSVEEMSLALHEILCAGGLGTGGFNFDAKLRRQSVDRTDLFHAHIGGLDTLARSLLVAAALLDDEVLTGERERRYAAWDGELGRAILAGERSLADLHELVTAHDLDPAPVSGRQEALENVVNRYVQRAGA
ncbi:MAG: xylose isomerase, partial [Actinomyces sp.]